LNRALDKPAEQVTIDQNVTVHFGLDQRIAAGRQRAARQHASEASDTSSVH
jgi:hypothetical protein